MCWSSSDLKLPIYEKNQVQMVLGSFTRVFYQIRQFCVLIAKENNSLTNTYREIHISANYTCPQDQTLPATNVLKRNKKNGSGTSLLCIIDYLNKVSLISLKQNLKKIGNVLQSLFRISTNFSTRNYNFNFTRIIFISGGKLKLFLTRTYCYRVIIEHDTYQNILRLYRKIIKTNNENFTLICHTNENEYSTYETQLSSWKLTLHHVLALRSGTSRRQI